ncbi:MAG: hypothetical protein R2800_00835 [Flavipsychrobacter sp.]
MSKRFFQVIGLIVLVALLVTDASAQRRRDKNKKEDVPEISIYDVDTLIKLVPLNMQRWHDKIDRVQEQVDLADGRTDGRIYYAENPELTNMLTEAMLKDIDQLEITIENLPTDSIDAFAERNMKIRYLRVVYDFVKRYTSDYKIDPYYYRRASTNLRGMIIADFEGRMSAFVKENINMYTLDNCPSLLSVASEDRAFIYREMGKREPEKLIKRLDEFATHPYACDIIKEAAKVVPSEVFNYASSTNYKLSNAVRACDDALVRTIVQIATLSKSPLKAMPFLNDVYRGKKTIPEIDAITADEDLFYQNLVRLKLENVSLGGDTYTNELQYRGLKYVREMNDLHEETGKVRFKCINGFSPETLYFIMVYGQDEIYTSSFLGTFSRMLERMDSTKGNELLENVHKDKFRTFLRMCAGYNTLSEFLATMGPAERTAVMKEFVGGLEKGKENDLEDAVDVADAFGSIKDTVLADFLRTEVKKNYEHSYQIKSKKGVIIYGLLASLFEKNKKADYARDAIRVTFDDLTNDSGTVYEQFYFYGDEDGAASYNSFLTNFKNKKWSITKTQYWTEIKSLVGKPVVIYANMPLKEPEDEVAIEKLCSYLAKNKIEPSIMVHRGHSYHLPLTLERLVKKTRVVMLGSCGGYHNLATVLDKSPDANIISSKQTGAMSVNEPIIKEINDQLLEGKDLNWIDTWKSLDVYFADKRGPVKDMFDDYVPPHKNLGAIFIKSYRRLFNADLVN